jgi:hypothetical protein
MMGCGTYFFRLMKSDWLAPLGGWQQASADFLLKLAMMPTPRDGLPAPVMLAIRNAQQAAARQEREKPKAAAK